MAFKVQTPDGAWHSTEDLTGYELDAIEKVTEVSWSVQNPYRDLGSYRAIVGAFALRTGMDQADLIEWFNTRTAGQLAAGLKLDAPEEDRPEYYEDGLPKAEGGSSTSTSAGSTTAGDGPPTK